MKIHFIWSTPKPWDLCQSCILGIWTLRDTDFLDIYLGLYFLDIGIEFDREKNA